MTPVVRRLARPALVLLAGAGTLAALAGAAPAAGPVPVATDGDGVALLQRAALAARSQPYTGTEFVSSWTRGVTTSAVVDVAHVPGTGSYVQVRPSVAGAPTSVFEADAADGPGDGRQDSAAALDSAALRLLARHYSVAVVSAGSCAGRPVTVIEATRSSGGALAGRFWVDRDAGLVLRREMFDATGRTVRASAFVSIDLDPAAAARSPAATASPAPRMVAPVPGAPLGPAELDGLRRDGWTVPAALPGDLTLYDARTSGSGSGVVIHLSYSDGLATVSVFEQRGRLSQAGPRNFARAEVGGQRVFVRTDGPDRVVWAAADRVFTVVADAPPETVEQVVAALPHQGSAGGVGSRLHRGLRRVLSWVNPFS